MLGTKIFVYVYDKDVLSRETIKILLKKIPNIEISGEFENTDDLVDKIKKKTPDIVIYDLHTNKLEDIIGIKSILFKNPKIKIIVTSTFEDFKTIVVAFSVGAIAFLIKKDLSVKDLSNAINCSKNNNHFISRHCEFKIEDIKKMIQLNDNY